MEEFRESRKGSYYPLLGAGSRRLGVACPNPTTRSPLAEMVLESSAHTEALVIRHRSSVDGSRSPSYGKDGTVEPEKFEAFGYPRKVFALGLFFLVSCALYSHGGTK